MKKSKTIYTITGINFYDNIWCTRCFGFCLKSSDAIELINKNLTDFHPLREENNFSYLVIESVTEGLYSLNRREIWFEWNSQKEQYEIIEKPTSFNNTCCYGIG
jgi:hypothetical protein